MELKSQSSAPAILGLFCDKTSPSVQLCTACTVQSVMGALSQEKITYVHSFILSFLLGIMVMLMIPLFKNFRQESIEFKVSLSYIVNPRSVQATVISCLTIKPDELIHFLNNQMSHIHNHLRMITILQLPSYNQYRKPFIM